MLDNVNTAGIYWDVLHAMYISWNLSKPASTPAPFIMDIKPSLAKICLPQSMEPLYLTPPPEVIIIRLLIVSMGQDMSPAVTVTPQPRRKESPTFPPSPIRMGFRVSNMPKYMKIPTAEMVNPLYRPWIPSDFRVFT